MSPFHIISDVASPQWKKMSIKLFIAAPKGWGFLAWIHVKDARNVGLRIKTIMRSII